MKFFVRGRQTGKTTGLASWAMSSPLNVIVTINEAEAERIRQEYRLPKAQVATYTSLSARQPRGTGMDVHISIDNAEMLIQSLFPGIVIDYVTATGEAL